MDIYSEGEILEKPFLENTVTINKNDDSVKPKRYLDQENQDLSPDEIKISNLSNPVISTRRALFCIASIAFPTSLFILFIVAQEVINLMFVQYVYENEEVEDVINAMGVSHLYINCFMLYISVGLIGAFENLGSNAYGSKEYYLLGLYFHRSHIINYSFIFLMLIFSYFFAIDLVDLLGLSKNVMIFVKNYLTIAMFFQIPDIEHSLTFRYLTIVGFSSINLIIMTVTFILHPVWCYIFIIYLDFKIEGAAIAIILSQAINGYLGLLYIASIKPNRESVFFLNKNSFKGLWEYLKIALPCALIYCAQYLCLVILAVIAIWCSSRDYTIYVITLNIGGLFFTGNFGFGMSACVLVGKYISEGNLQLTRKYIRIIIVSGLTFQIILSSLLIIFREEIFKIFIDHDDLLEKGSDVILILAFAILADNIQQIFSNILKALGKQFIASLFAFCIYYVFIVGLSYYFGKYLLLGVYGIWLALLVGVCLLNLMYIILYLTLNLDKIIKETKNRMANDKKLIGNGIEDKQIPQEEIVIQNEKEEKLI